MRTRGPVEPAALPLRARRRTLPPGWVCIATLLRVTATAVLLAYAIQQPR